MKEDAIESEELASVFLQQGDAKRAAAIFARILQRQPDSKSAAEGLAHCRQMLRRGEDSMKDRRLAVLKLLLARLRGEPVETQPTPVLDPRQKRRKVLEQLLEKVTTWRAQLARHR